MEELKQLWHTYDEKLERSLSLNKQCIEMIQAQKIKSKLKGLLILRIAEGLIHIAALLYLLKFLAIHFFEFQFSISAAILILFFIVAFTNCIKQIILIMQIDYSESITDIQRKLMLLNTHIVNYMRLSFLVLPTYWAYPVIGLKVLANIDVFVMFTGGWWLSQVVFSLLLFPVCVWLYKEVSIKNLHKKWVRYIIEKSGGQSVSKAMQFIKQIDDYKIGVS